MAKIIDFFDGAQTLTVPTIGNIQASALSTYASDAAFETANGPGQPGDVYINTTLDVIRFWNADLPGWDSVLSSGGPVDASNIADGSVSNTEFQYLNGVTSSIQTQLNTSASNIATIDSDLDTHVNALVDAHDAEAISVVPVGNLTSTHVQNALTELQTDVDSRISSSEKGAANGVAPLNGSSKIDATYLPSYVDDVVEYANLASFPVSGETGKIYVALDTNKTYRWTGSIYVEISPSEVISVNGATGAVTVNAINQLTGDVTAGPASGSQSQSATIANDAVSNAKLANMATQTIKGRTTAGTGDPEDLTATQATAILNNFVGDSGSGGTKGLVPAPASGDAAANKYLKADGTWATVSGSGANQSLSNLTNPTSINEDLILQTGKTIVLPNNTSFIAKLNDDSPAGIFNVDTSDNLNVTGPLGLNLTANTDITFDTNTKVDFYANDEEVNIKSYSQVVAPQLKLWNAAETFSVGLKAPDALAANETYTLPSADGSVSGQPLTTNASGTLSFTDVASFGQSTALTDYYWGNSVPALVIDGTTTDAQTAFAAGIVFKGTDNQASLLIQTQDRTDTNPTSSIYIASGKQTNTGNTGWVIIETGQATSGNSGNIQLITNPASGTRGKIYFQDGSQGTIGHVWTSTGTQGQGAWQALPASGANTTLSNLTAPTAVNQPLLMAAGNHIRLANNQPLKARNAANTVDVNLLQLNASDDIVLGNNTGYNIRVAVSTFFPNNSNASLGAAIEPWENFYVNNIRTGLIWPDNNATIRTANGTSSNSFNVQSGTATTGSSGNVTLSTGNSTSGNSGNIILTAGSAGGTRGYIQFAALVAVMPTGSADPSTSYPDGSCYYNTSTDQIRVLRGGTWRGITLT